VLKQEVRELALASANSTLPHANPDSLIVPNCCRQ